MGVWSDQEFPQRWARMQRLMQAQKIDALLISEATNYRYLTGQNSAQFLHKMRPMVILLPATGEPSAFIYSLEEPLLRIEGWNAPIRPYIDVPFPVQDLADLMREAGLGAATIGAEIGINQRLGMPYEDFVALKSALPEANWVDAGGILTRAQMIKSSEEIALIRRACEITQAAWLLVLERVRPNITIRDIELVVSKAMIESGADPDMPGLIMVRQLSTGERDGVFRSGDFLKLDFGARHYGYYADVTRMAVIGGEVTSAHRAVHQRMSDMLQGCIEQITPGRSVSEVAAFNNTQLASLGYPTLVGTKRIGHGVGLELTQPPSLNSVDTTLFEPGMVVAVEPRFDCEFGRAHLEEIVLVTETGYEQLSRGSEVLGVTS